MTDTMEVAADTIVQLPAADLRLHDGNRAVTEDDVDDIVASARTHGILEPLIVHELADGGHEVIAGARRRMAAIVAGLEHVPCIVRRNLTEREVVELRLIENMSRRALHPLDEAEIFGELRKLGASQSDIGALLASNPKSKVSQPTVSKRLSLLALSDRAKIAFRNDQLTIQQAEALAALCKKAPDRADVVLDKVEGDARAVDSELRHQLTEIKVEEERVAKVAELEAAGTPMVDDYGWTSDSMNVPLAKIGVSEEEHRDQPCHAAHVDDRSRVTWVCTDMTRHGTDTPDASGNGSAPSSRSDDWEQQQADHEAARRADEEARANRLAAIQVTIAGTRSKSFALDYLVKQISADEILDTFGSDIAGALGLDIENVDVDVVGDVLRAYIGDEDGGDNVAYFAMALAWALGEAHMRWGGDAPEFTVAIRRHFDVLTSNGYEPTEAELERLTAPPVEDEQPEDAPDDPEPDDERVVEDPDDGYDEAGFPLPNAAIPEPREGMCEASGRDFNLAGNATGIPCPKCLSDVDTDETGRVVEHEAIIEELVNET